MSNGVNYSKKNAPSTKQNLLMHSLTDFFQNVENLNRMLPIIYGESRISLRILDWFVTNYSKKRNIIIDHLQLNGKYTKFIVYLDYKSQLKAYSKRQFDPFCRRERIIFLDQNKNGIQTTVGQLNFFRWALENKIIDYVEQNLEDIEKDMNHSIRNLYKKNKKAINQLAGSSADALYEIPDLVSINNTQILGNKHVSHSQLSIPNTILELEENIDNKKRRKRKELSISATKTVNKHDIKIIVKFE